MAVSACSWSVPMDVSEGEGKSFLEATVNYWQWHVQNQSLDLELAVDRQSDVMVTSILLGL